MLHELGTDADQAAARADAAFPRSETGRMRVLINGIHANSGGGVTYLRNMLPWLARDRRIELHLIVRSEQFGFYGTIDNRIRVHTVDLTPGFWHLLIWEQWMLPRIARELAIEVTFSPANFGPLFAPNPVVLLRNSLAVAKVERRPTRRLYWAALTGMTTLSLLLCRRAIAVSEYARSSLTRHLPSKFRRKVVVIHHGVDRAFSPQFENGSDDGSPFLLAVGDVYVQKNLHTLIRAYATVRQTVPSIRLKVAGGHIDKDYSCRLKREVAALGLEDDIEFLGRLDMDALIALYRSCAAFVFPSTVETFGNPLTEAMSCAAPIACSETTAMPEIVGDAALLFDPYDADDIARTVLRILLEPDLAATLRARGLQRAALFSWTRTAELTADVLMTAAERRVARQVPASGSAA